MPVSVRMAPVLERELDLAAKRQGISKSQFIIDAVERALGRADPYKLLREVRAAHALETRRDQARVRAAPVESERHPPSTGERVRKLLQAKHDRAIAEWEADAAASRHAVNGKTTKTTKSTKSNTAMKTSMKTTKAPRARSRVPQVGLGK